MRTSTGSVLQPSHNATHIGFTVARTKTTNKTKAKSRPFIARNLVRLGKVETLFSAIMKDLGRVKKDQPWADDANSFAHDLAKAFDGMQKSFESAPADYVAKRVAPRRPGSIVIGDQVTVSPLFVDKYSTERIGMAGNVGTVLDKQPSGFLVQFVDGLPAVVKSKHLVRENT